MNCRLSYGKGWTGGVKLWDKKTRSKRGVRNTSSARGVQRTVDCKGRTGWTEKNEIGKGE